MKFLLRVIGTWFLGLALVLTIIDGAKTLAGSALAITPLAKTWSDVHADSWNALLEYLATTLAAYPQALEAVKLFFSMPSWGVFAFVGLLLLILGRRRRRSDRFVETY